MKNILFLVLVFKLLSACEKKTESQTTQTPKNEATSTKKEIYGNLELNEKYNSLLSKVQVFNDSLKGHDFFNTTFKKVDCKCNFHKDYNNEVEGFTVRETEILIENKIKLSVLYKNGQNYLYTFNDKPFKVKNYFGEMYAADSEINFSFDARECYRISKNKFLMREQPSRWCGLADQFVIYQIADLDKMEMLQFAERSDKLK